jgi:hypothetical protein
MWAGAKQFLLLIFLFALGLAQWLTRVQITDEVSRRDSSFKYTLMPGVREQIEMLSAHRRLLPNSSKRLRYYLCLLGIIVCFSLWIFARLR